MTMRLAPLAVAGLCASALAGDLPPIVVNPGGSIQLAINQAVDGQEIHVEPGTYIGPIQYASTGSNTPKAVILKSTDGPDMTTIDATSFQQTVVLVTDVSVPGARLEGFTITGGDGPVDGGGLLVTNSTFTVDDCVFRMNTSARHGGGAATDNSDVTFTECVFEDNHSTSVGGAFYSLTSDGSETFTDCMFTGNSAGSPGGGAIYSNAPLTVTGSVFESNFTTGAGGAIHGRAGAMNFDRTTFQTNRSNGSGGALYLVGGAASNITFCSFQANITGGSGSAMYVSDRDLFVEHSTFVGHDSDSAIQLVSDGTADINSSTFAANVSSFNVNGSRDATSILNCSAVGTGSQLLTGRAVSVRHCNMLLTSVGSGSVSPNEGNFFADPVFVRDPDDGGDGWNDDLATTEVDESANNDYGDLRLTAGSPNIDRGDSKAYDGPLTDFADAQRGVNDPDTPDDNGIPVIGPIVIDVGAFEYQTGSSCLCEVDGNSESVNISDLLAFLGCWFPASDGAPCN